MKDQSRHSSQSTEESTDSGASSFSDTETLESSTVLEPPLPKKHIATLLTKTTLCKHFLRGHCRFGEKCSYAHNTAELLPKPDLMKTRMCTHFMVGRCRNDKCNFAHGMGEVQQKAGSEEPPSPTSPLSLPTPWRLPPGLDGDMSMSQPPSPPTYRKPHQASWQDVLQQSAWQAAPLTPEKSQMQRRRQQEPWQAEPMKVGVTQDNGAGLATPKMVGIQAMARNQTSQPELYDVLRTCEHTDQHSDAMRRLEMAYLLMSNCRMAL